MEETRNLQIIATLDSSLDIEARKRCLCAGAKVDRIHTAKMDIPSILRVIRLDTDTGLDIMVDLPGIKGRTQKTHGMIQSEIPGEENNWLLPVPKNWKEKEFRFWLVSLSTSEEQMADGDKYVRATIIPDQLEVGDTVVFGDNNITTEVIATSNLGLQLQVVNVKPGSPGIWWRMGYTSSTEDLFTGHQSILSEYDISVLEAISEAGLQDQINEIAFSFIAQTAHISETISILKKLNYDFNRVKIVLKIETLEAIDNLKDLAEISSVLIAGGNIIVFELGRGDLGVDCESKGRDIQEVQTSFLGITREWSIPVIIATDVASSTIGTNRSGEDIRLSRPEKRQLIRETFCRLAGATIVGYMLAAETKIVPHPQKTIKVVKRTLDRAERLSKVIGRI
jgi:pyruvate kinase